MSDRFFKVGTKVWVDGARMATVREIYPEGSSSYLFAHYKVDFFGGDLNVAVAMPRVFAEELLA